MTLKEFFSKGYLFDPVPTSQSKMYVVLLVVFSLMIIAAILISFQKEEIKKIAKKFSAAFYTIGILGLVYLFSRYEGLPGLASRFFLLLILTLFVLWMTALLIWLSRVLPQHFESKKRDEKYYKYLPKAKKKNC